VKFIDSFLLKEQTTIIIGNKKKSGSDNIVTIYIINLLPLCISAAGDAMRRIDAARS
jgi:hypothetical protein